jgi:hypothetical protein
MLYLLGLLGVFVMWVVHGLYYFKSLLMVLLIKPHVYLKNGNIRYNTSDKMSV